MRKLVNIARSTVATYINVLRPVYVAYAWHCAAVALLWLFLPFDRACLVWIVLNFAGWDAAAGYGIASRRRK
ncbi:hypothetical protein [Mesorhizobium sp. INR15]|uniref:hypothetical protein n=1 Tax=Mesorhizobium sp. INR15 TaxID=2654248 RepID=UPI0018969883|nr:hypothetical protein [Mesorhizobium sp. INR15]QPC91476.1 hypothetical protein GA829_13125 [Mesorhizobium sp. INR15]